MLLVYTAMDETSFREAILADYISKVEKWPRDKLLQELLDIKLRLLELSSDNEAIKQLNEQRHGQN